MLPRVDLLDDTTMQIAVTLECAAITHLNAARSFAGGVLRIPLRQIFAQPNTVPLMFYGMLTWNDEHDGLVIPGQPYTRNLAYVEAPISDEQAERFERKRLGREAALHLRLRGLVAVSGATKAVTMMSPTPLMIPLETWLRVLSALGYGERRIIELPAPPTGVGGLWDQASRSLSAAARRFTAGDVGAAMSEGRIAIERAVEAIGEVVGRPRADGESVRNYFEAVAGVIEKRHVARSDDAFAVLADGVRLAYKAFGFSSDPTHTTLDAGERTNTELALAVTTALYTYFVRVRPLVTNGASSGSNSMA